MTKKEFQKLPLIEQLKKYGEDYNYYNYLNDNLKKAIDKKDISLVPELEEELEFLYNLIYNSNEATSFSEKLEANQNVKIVENLLKKEEHELNKFLKEKVFYQLSKLNNNVTYLNTLYTADRKTDKFNNLEVITNYPYKFYHDIRNLSILESMEYESPEQQEKIKKEYIYIKTKTDKFFRTFENGLLNKKEIKYEDIPEKYLNEIAKEFGIKKEFDIKNISISEYKKLRKELEKKKIEDITLNEIKNEEYEILKSEIKKDIPEIEEKDLEEKILEKYKKEKERELENLIINKYRERILKKSIEQKLKEKDYKEVIKRKFEDLIIEKFKNDLNLKEEDYKNFEKALQKKEKILSKDEILDNDKINEKTLEIDNKIRLYKNKILSISDNNNSMLFNGIEYSTKGLDKNQKTILLDYISVLKEHTKKDMLRILRNNVPILPLWGDFDFLKENNEVKSGNLKYGDLFINDIPIIVEKIQDKDKNKKLLETINKVSKKTGVTAEEILNNDGEPTGKIKLKSVDGKSIYIKANENGEKISGLHQSHITEFYYDKLKELYNNSNVVHENTLSTFLIDKKLENEKVYPELNDNELFAYYYYDKETMQTKVKFGTKENIEKFTRNTEQKNIINFNNKNTLDIYLKKEKFDAKELIKGVKPIVDPKTGETTEGKNIIIPLYKNIFQNNEESDLEDTYKKEFKNIDKSNLRNFYSFITELELELFESPKIDKNLKEKVDEIKKEFNKKLETDYKEDLQQMRLKIKDTENKIEPKVELMDKNSKYENPILENEKSEKIKNLLKTISNKTNELNFYLNNNKEKLLDLEKIQKLQREIDDKTVELHNFLDKEFSDDSIEDKSYTKSLKHFFEKEKPDIIKDFIVGFYDKDEKFAEKFKKQFLTKEFWNTLESVEKDIYIERRDYLRATNDLYKSLMAKGEVENEIDNNLIFYYIFPIGLAPSLIKDLFNLHIDVNNFTNMENIYYQQIEKHKKERLIPAVEKALKETMPFLNKENSEVVKEFAKKFVKIESGSQRSLFNKKNIYDFKLKDTKEMVNFVKEMLKKYEDSIDVNSINTGPGSEINNIKTTSLNIQKKIKDNLKIALKEDVITKLNLNLEELEPENEDIVNIYIKKFIENIKESENNSNNGKINENEILLKTIKYFEDNFDNFETIKQEFIKKYIINNKLILIKKEEFETGLKDDTNNLIFDTFENIYKQYNIENFGFDENNENIKRKLKEKLKIFVEDSFNSENLNIKNLIIGINKLISEHSKAILPEVNKKDVTIKELLNNPEEFIKENVNLENLTPENINKLIETINNKNLDKLKTLNIIDNSKVEKIENLLITNLKKQLQVNIDDLPYNEKKILTNLFKEYVEKFKENTNNFKNTDNLQEVVKNIVEKFETNMKTDNIERQKVIEKYFLQNKDNLLKDNFNENIKELSNLLVDFNKFNIEDIKLLKNELIKKYLNMNFFNDNTALKRIEKFVDKYKELIPEEFKNSNFSNLSIIALRKAILNNKNLEINRNKETFSFINMFNIYKKHKKLINEAKKLQENSNAIKNLKEKYENTVSKKEENKEKSDKNMTFDKNKQKFERNF